jgi:lysophospholipase L1-like esterase
VFGASSLVAACGGGGGSADPVAATPPPSAGTVPQPVTAALSPNIVAWGDSLTPAFALNLQLLYPDRVVLPEGFLGQTSTVVTTAALADTDHRNWINVFWSGHNDFAESPATAPATIKANIAQSVAHLSPGNDRFIVMGVINNAVWAYKGTDVYGSILKLDADLAATYPDNFIDIRSWLVANGNASDPTDEQDEQEDVPPQSLRYDDIHLRNEGSVLVAQRVKQFIDAKGW